MQLGRYVVLDAIGAGGMATVHLGRMIGPLGFGRTVAIKRMHPHLAAEGDVVRMFLDEARMAAQVHHPNVAAILDVVSQNGESFIVMEYVNGEALARLLSLSQGRPIPVPVVKSILVGMLHGLHAAHEAVDEQGVALGMIHRDVSPQNVIIGVDGAARLVDFGVAKARGRSSQTTEGQLKGKLAYMAPEQVEQAPVDRRTDIFAAGIVAWETLTGARMYIAKNEVQMFMQVMAAEIDRPSVLRADVDRHLDDIVLRSLARDPEDRFPTAMAMADAIERAGGLATVADVRTWFDSLAGDRAAARAQRMIEIENEMKASEPMLQAAAAVPDGPAIEVFGTAMPLPAPRASMASLPPSSMTTPAGASPAGASHRLPQRRKGPSRMLVVLLAVGGVAALALSIAARASYSREAASHPSAAPTPMPAPQADDPGQDTAAPATTEAAAVVPAAPPPTASAARAADTAAIAITNAAATATAANGQVAAPALGSMEPHASSSGHHSSAGRSASSPDAGVGVGACTYSSYVGADGIKHYARVCP